MSVGSFQLPSIQQAFGTQYYGTLLVSGFSYDVSNGVLYTIYPTINYDVFLGVPMSVAQQFAVADRQLGGSYRNPVIPQPDNLYTNAVAGSFKQCLLCENGAPFLCENGQYITVN
jgi:hypothetical protein